MAEGEHSRDADSAVTRRESVGGEGEGEGASRRLRERGESVGRYVLVDLIGQGGMGVVYLAWDPQLDRRLALKLVSLSTGGSSEGGGTHGARLLREAQALARLEHPHVVQIHDVGETDGQVFIAMEHVEGESLRDWLRPRRSRRRIVEVFLAAARGLAAAHGAGLVHRDFKPDNVLVGFAGEVKVVDFGLARDARAEVEAVPRTRQWAQSEPAVARALERAGSQAHERAGDSGVPEIVSEEGSAPHSVDAPDSKLPRTLVSSHTSNITVAGTVLGTPAYMAPEQHERATVDARSDQYAFCVALWEALYGKRPFSGRRSNSLARRKRKQEIRESSRGLRVPRGLRRVMLRGLAPAADDRFADMDELIAALEPFAGGGRLVPGLAVAGALAVAAVAVFASFEKSREPGSLCAAPVERLEGVWDEPRRAEIEAAVLASELAYAEDTWARVRDRLDDYSEDWLAAQVEACEATRVEGKRSPAWLERRTACLDERRRELASLSAQLAQSDARTVEHAARAAGSLAPISACARERGRGDRMPLPDDPHLRLRVERQIDQLAEARAALGSGHLAEGLRSARRVREVAEELGWAPLEAEVAFLIGNREADEHQDRRRALATLHEAAGAALRGRHHFLAVQIWSRVARELVALGEFEGAERWIAYADRLAEELAASEGEAGARDPRLEADLEHGRAQLRFHQEDYAGAEAHARRRLELLRDWYGEDSPRHADALNNLGVTVYMQHRKDEAVEAYARALAILERVQGPDHPSVATMHNNIGVVLTDKGRWTGARVHYRRAVEIRARVYPARHPLVLQSLTNLANLYLMSGAPAGGLEAAGIAVEEIEALLAEELAERRAAGASDSELAVAGVELVPHLLRFARLLAVAGEQEQARANFERALKLLDATPGARLPPEFAAPAEGERWPASLEGCRVDVLRGLEQSAAALGDSERAQWARGERLRSPVKQEAYMRRCTDELSRWSP